VLYLAGGDLKVVWAEFSTLAARVHGKLTPILELNTRLRFRPVS
jgi:hypothetical protein